MENLLLTALSTTTAPNWIQFIGTIISSAIGAGVAVYLLRWKDRERIHCSIGWKLRGNPQHYDERAVLLIHNKSEKLVAVSSMRYYDGSFIRRKCGPTALDYDDPREIGFPYRVPAEQIEKLPLDQAQAITIVGEGGYISTNLSRFGRSRIRVQIVTTAGNKFTVSAEDVIPDSLRPKWLQR